ncbi:Major facilitator super domain-containing protein 7 [Thoreauomyces humboldtii]|nr:Major facilitator super domain-containing protein 7 [Thoreauomyces humboldtii]
MSDAAAPQVAPRFRWMLVALFSLLNFSNAWNWSAYAGDSPNSALYYEVKTSAVTWFSLVFMAVFVPFTFASSWVLDGYGIRQGLMVGLFLNGAGAIVRYLSCFIDGSIAGRYAVAFVGQTISAAAQPFILNAAPKIANIWFGPSERTLADAVMNLANPIGAAVALVVGPIVIDSTPSNLPPSLLVAMIVSLAPFPFAPFIFKNRVVATSPTAQVNHVDGSSSAKGRDVSLEHIAGGGRLAPSSSSSSSLALMSTGTAATGQTDPETQNRIQPAVPSPPQANIPFRVACQNLAHNRDYLLLCGSFGLAIGIFNTLVSEISYLADETGYTSDEAGYLGFGAIIVGIVGSLIASVALDKSERLPRYFGPPGSGSPHAKVFRHAYLFAIVALVGFAICTRPNVFALLMLFSCLFGLGAFAVLPTSLELGVEITYDLAGEAVATGGMWSAGQICGLVMAVVTDGIRSARGADVVKGYEVWIMPAVGVVGIVLGWMVKVDSRRVKAEQTRAENSARSLDTAPSALELSQGGTDQK